MFFTMLVVGTVSWLVGKLVGSAQTFHSAPSSWRRGPSCPDVLGAVSGGVQGLLMDPASLTGQTGHLAQPRTFRSRRISRIRSRYQFLGRFDLITIWVTILLAIGLYVTGKVSKGRATVFGIIIWLVGALPALRQAYMSM